MRQWILDEGIADEGPGDGKRAKQFVAAEKAAWDDYQAPIKVKKMSLFPFSDVFTRKT